MFKRSAKVNRPRIVFIDEKNDLQSQIAEFFAKESIGSSYEVFSAGPSSDCVDCELISVMYQLGYDIRESTSKDFNSDMLPEGAEYAIFLEKSTYDKVKDNMPWECKVIFHDFGRKENFEEATDDRELYECYKKLIENVREWVENELPSSLGKGE